MDFYDIEGIIGEALRSGRDITPADRQEWKMFCCSCKVLGLPESTFAALSSIHGTAERVSRQAWRAETAPHRYRTHDQAAGMIVRLAREAGVEVDKFRLSHRGQHRPKRQSRPSRPRWQQRQTSAPPRPANPNPTHITAEQIERARAAADKTALYAFLCREFGKEATVEAFERYRVGGSNFAPQIGWKATSFPYIDTSGNCVDCKLMHLNPDTGSRKTDTGHLPTSWALAELLRRDKGNYPPETTTADLRARWCNFGDHLTAERPTAPIAVVESEKTALICSMVYPQHVWVAVGSKSNLNAARFEPYRGRTVIVFPDRDGYNDTTTTDNHGKQHTQKGWVTLARGLVEQGFTIFVDHTTERNPGEPNDDLADIVLRWRHGKQQPPEPQRGAASETEAAEETALSQAEKEPQQPPTPTPPRPSASSTDALNAEIYRAIGEPPQFATPAYSEWSERLMAFYLNRNTQQNQETNEQQDTHDPLSLL